ncbi:MAG: hypothetical protein N2201_01975, partial [candidate division WOR-3 bacterium]|nr:hypothetical protein [candidate division WOR-3 bacterium]
VEAGTLIADGSAGNIIFTAEEEAGYWSGIVFDDGTNDYLTRLNHCIVQYGGDNNHNYGPANIVCENSAPRITNTQICHGRGWGMILRNSTLDPDSLRRYNRFYNNDSGDIRVDTTKFYRPLIANRKEKINNKNEPKADMRLKPRSRLSSLTKNILPPNSKNDRFLKINQTKPKIKE